MTGRALPRRALLQAAAGLGIAPLAASAAAAPSSTERVLRYAFPTAETGFDPQRVSDIYSRIITAHIFESLYDYDPLARPYKIVPALADGLPETSSDGLTWTVRLKRGVMFQADAVFSGSPRELVAEDVVYSWKRIYDPVVQSPAQSSLEEQGVIGLRELRAAAIEHKRPFDYDTPIDGLQALDRHTVRFRLRAARPRFLYALAGNEVMAREVVEHHGDQVSAHPVGTGPFMLQSWRRSSLMVLVRHPGYRERTYDAHPNADDAEGQALLARFKGRRLPMVDRVEVSVIEESQPRWLSFLNAEHDLLERLPNEFVNLAVPGGELAPHLAKRGIRAQRVAGSDVTLTVFNMTHPLVGGLQVAQVALRRAICLGLNVPREIALARRGQALRAQTINTPGTFGFDASLRTEAGLYDPARANALLDLHGFADRDRDGWRERPDGSPLVLQMLSQSDQASRQLDELFKKDMDALGLRLDLKIGQWAENLKASRAGRFMMWRVGSSSTTPDGQSALEWGDSRSIGKGNLARFSLPAFDAVYDRLQGLPDDAERLAQFREAHKLLLAYAPYRVHVHRLLTDLTHPWVVGYRRPSFGLRWWQYVDVLPRS